MKFDDDTFVQYAASQYDNIQCTSLKEFNEDLLRFKYLNKLFFRYVNKNELKDRLILNHIIILYNVFGAALNDMLFFKVDKSYWNILATFLVYLNRLPEELLSEFSLDQNVINTLRKI